jgi:translation initiation factor 5A
MNKLKENVAPYNFEYSQAGSIKKGSYCMLEGQPCKIIDLAISKPGKHGSAKILLTGINLLNDKKVQ